MITDELWNARVKYIDAAIAEIAAVANVVDNDDPTKHELLVQRSMDLGHNCEIAFQEFRDVASTRFPENPALADLVNKTNEN